MNGLPFYGSVAVPDPFQAFDQWFKPWREWTESFLGGWLSQLRPPKGDSPTDIAVARINAMQIILYRRYVKQHHLKKFRGQKDLQRFIRLWMERHSKNFRALLNLHPEWLSEFTGSSKKDKRLFWTIERNLYQ